MSRHLGVVERRLRTHPHIQPVLLQMDRGVAGLHGGMRQKRRFIYRLHHMLAGLAMAALASPSLRAVTIGPSSASRYSWANCSLSVLAAAPPSQYRFQLLQRLVGAPVIVGDHRDGVVELDHLLDAARALKALSSTETSLPPNTGQLIIEA